MCESVNHIKDIFTLVAVIITALLCLVAVKFVDLNDFGSFYGTKCPSEPKKTNAECS